MATSPQNPPEQRSKPRARLIVHADCALNHALSLGKTEDVSESGLRITTPETFEVGADVTVQFSLPGAGAAGKIAAKGVVARAAAGQWMAIHFSEIKNEDREAIGRYVAST